MYSGSPHGIDTYLNQSNIIQNRGQVSVEQLIVKLASINIKDDLIDQLIAKTRVKAKSEINYNEIKISPEGIPFRSKHFKTIDIWYIISRLMAQVLADQWKRWLFQLVFYSLIPIMIAMMLTEDMGRPDGFCDQNKSNTCAKDRENDE